MTIPTDLDRNLGPQPIAALLEQHKLSHHDVVNASPEPITHKLVARACKGRRLTANSRNKIIRAMEKVLGKTLSKKDLFTY
jgi:hypothetical protein